MYRLLSLTLLSPLFFACGGDSAPVAEGTTLAASAEAPAKNQRSCLNDFDGDLCDLLDYAAVAEFFPGKAEKGGYRSTERGMLSSCQFSYESPTETRKLDVGAMKMDVPVNYSLALGSFKASKAKDPLAHFRSSYKTLTAEEAASFKAEMDKGLKAKLDAGEINQETYEAAKGFGGLAGKAVYEDIPGVGTAAAWGGVPMKQAPSAADLYVLHGNFTFSISADMGTMENSKAAAIALAKAVLARCE